MPPSFLSLASTAAPIKHQTSPRQPLRVLNCHCLTTDGAFTIPIAITMTITETITTAVP